MQNKQINLKTNNSGRSMLEMLGVLAIMGVLSVGGIQGYRYALDRYNATQLVYDVDLRLDVIKMQLTQENEISLGEFSNTSTGGYNFLDVEENENGDIVLSVDGISYGVCQKIPHIVQDRYIVTFNETSGICEDYKKNMVNFYLIENDTILKKCSDTNPCGGECSECQKGICVNKDVECPGELICNQGKCMCPPEKPARDLNGDCHSCNEENPFLVGPYYTTNVIPECQKCPGYFLAGDWHKWCTNCGLAGTLNANKPLSNGAGKCLDCEHDGIIEMESEGTTCYNECPNWVAYKGNNWCVKYTCPSGKPLLGSDRICHPCDYVGDVFANGPNVTACSDCNRTIVDNKCILP